MAARCGDRTVCIDVVLGVVVRLDETQVEIDVGWHGPHIGQTAFGDVRLRASRQQGVAAAHEIEARCGANP